MENMKQLSVPFEIKREPDADGRFEGYASVFHIVDHGMDVVQPGAFTKSLGDGRKVKMLWQHDQAQPIGVWDEIKEDERGLFVQGRLLKDVRQAAEAMTLMKAGVIDSMSIGYRVVDATPMSDGRVRSLNELDLFEVSLVTFPMLPDAVVTDVKSLKTIRDFENALRDAGFSQREAKAVAADGFSGLLVHRDDASNEVDRAAFDEVANEIRQLQERFNV